MLLHNARIVLPERIAVGADLLIENQNIAKIWTGPLVSPSAVDSIDLNGLTLFPGFIDIHIHGAVGVDANKASGSELGRVAAFLSENGVTAWLPTLVPDSYENYRAAIAAIDELARQQNLKLERPGARALGVHYEGPFVNEHQCGALRAEFFKDFAGGDELKSLPSLADSNAIHLTTLAPEINGGIELIEALDKQHWIVSIGHTRAPADVLDRALAAGARHMTHFMNAMAPLHHRAPGPVGWGLAHDDVTCDFIADGRHLDPLMLRLLVKLKGTNRLTLISDSIAAAGLGEGDYEIWGETITVKNGRTSNARGSIAGSVITMLEAAHMMLSLGVSEIDVARMAATNPARLLRIDGECGSIAEGKRADLVALDQNGKVRLTIIGGQIAFKSEPPAVAGGPVD